MHTGGIALTIFGVAWWNPWVKDSHGPSELIGTMLGMACAVAGVVFAFLGY